MLRVGLLIAGAVLLLDQVSKHWVLNGLGFRLPRDCGPGHYGCGHIEVSSVFDLTMVWNYGVSFGMLRAEGIGRWLLAGFSLAVAGLFAWWLRSAERRLTVVALGLIIGGAIGNFIDRVRYGAVVDFLDFSGPWFGLFIGQTPLGFPWVFNVADAAISVGFCALLLDFFLEGKSAPERASVSKG